jgi:hypothetical protein
MALADAHLSQGPAYKEQVLTPPGNRQQLPAGHHQVIWDGRDRHGRQVAAGVYFTRFSAGGYAATEKTMYMR